MREVPYAVAQVLLAEPIRNGTEIGAEENYG